MDIDLAMENPPFSRQRLTVTESENWEKKHHLFFTRLMMDQNILVFWLRFQRWLGGCNARYKHGSWARYT